MPRSKATTGHNIKRSAAYTLNSKSQPQPASPLVPRRGEDILSQPYDNPCPDALKRPERQRDGKVIQVFLEHSHSQEGSTTPDRWLSKIGFCFWISKLLGCCKIPQCCWGVQAIPLKITQIDGLHRFVCYSILDTIATMTLIDECQYDSCSGL